MRPRFSIISNPLFDHLYHIKPDMKRLSQLLSELRYAPDSEKAISLVRDYLMMMPREDSICTMALFAGRPMKKCITAEDIKTHLATHLGLPLWLIEESVIETGNLSEALALLCRPKRIESLSFSAIYTTIEQLQNADVSKIKKFLSEIWDYTGKDELILIHQLLLGQFKSPVEDRILHRAIHQAFGIAELKIPDLILAQILKADNLDPEILQNQYQNEAHIAPLPFHHTTLPIDKIEGKTEWENYTAEILWEGHRTQAILREGMVYLWSHKGLGITHQFPELATALRPYETDMILEGVIQVTAPDTGKPDNLLLQNRLNRPVPDAKVLRNSPARFIVYDLLWYNGEDITHYPALFRHQILQSLLLFSDDSIRLNEVLSEEEKQSILAENNLPVLPGSKGIIYKHLQGSYGGEKKEDAWLLHTQASKKILALLLYAEPIHQQEEGHHYRLKFGVWDHKMPVPIATVEVEMNEEEDRLFTAFLASHTQERFGGVHSLLAEKVFALGFEKLIPSKRHKAGLQICEAKILHESADTHPQHVHTLSDLQKWL